jgi:hypothetical protein
VSSSAQTIIALGIVALAAILLLRSFLKKRKQPGCGDSCSAVTPEIRDLKSRLK